MRKWIIALCVGMSLGASVSAQQIRNQLMTAQEMVAAAHAVKNPKTQPWLEQWVRVCLKKEWGNCQVAWLNLAEQGGLTQIENEGYSSWGFLDQPDANQVLMHMVTALNAPAYVGAWDMEITTTKQVADVPNVVDGRNALTDGTDQRIALAIITERFMARNVVYAVQQEMPGTRMEWMRLVALMYAVRDEKPSAYQALAELQKQAKGNPEAIDPYNKTVNAIQEYLKKGVLK